MHHYNAGGFFIKRKGLWKIRTEMLQFAELATVNDRHAITPQLHFLDTKDCLPGFH